MKLAFAINELRTERSGYTTTHLALRALRRGHQVWYVEVGDFALAPDGRLDAYARRLPVDRINDVDELIAALNATVREKTDLSGLDALFLRK